MQSEYTNLVFLEAVDLTGNIYTDQTGRFPVTSSKGKNYILVPYHYDSNTIHVEPLKTGSGLDLKTAYQKLHSIFTNIGFKPVLHILDNECPYMLKTFMKEVNAKFHSPAPHPSQKLSRIGHSEFQIASHCQAS